jgi:hypothetical protein
MDTDLPQNMTARPGVNWRCNACSLSVLDDVIPRGWYVLQRSRGTAQERHLRLGLYCSAYCLGEAVDGPVTDAEKDLGEDWVEKTRGRKSLARRPG